MALEHGGRVRAAARYGIPEKDWLDLSTGINPGGWPVPPVPGEIWQALPQDDDGLVDAACRFYGTSEVLAVAGSQAAIMALPRLKTPCRVALSSPSYAEHEYAWREHEVYRVDDPLQSDAEVVVIVNPNNPTGRLYTVDELLALHARLAARGGWLIVDEAFMDATPEHSLAPFCPREGLIVLRSLGKFFGLAGARVGFVLAEKNILQALDEMLGPWPVAAPSRFVAERALGDTAWQQEARRTLGESGLRLSDLLIRHDLKPSGGTALFQWVCIDDALGVHEQLARQGILTRLFAFPASLRFGLPQSGQDWTRLDAALGKVKR